MFFPDKMFRTYLKNAISEPPASHQHNETEKNQVEKMRGRTGEIIDKNENTRKRRE
jgi:hypothetical protein